MTSYLSGAGIPTGTQPASWGQRRAWILVLINLIVLVALLAVVGFLLWNRGSEPTPAGRTQAPAAAPPVTIRWGKPHETDECVAKTPQGRIPGGRMITTMGNAAKGGSEVLSQEAIQVVMRRSIRRLAPCAVSAARRDNKLKQVVIDFGVNAKGRVAYVKANGQSAGSLRSCLAVRMSRLRFKPFDGAMTHASFTMHLK